jgi:Zn finger protein HypA/HybF involved in hydrogenase expression
MFWWVYTRLRLWYLYHGKDVPLTEQFTWYTCPTCNWNTTDVDDYDNCKSFLGSSGYYQHYDCGSSWTEHWKCPRCGTKFDVNNGT